MCTEKQNPQLWMRRKGAERNQFVCANESKAGSHQGQIEHEISGSEVLEDGSEDTLDCVSGKAVSKLTLTKLLKFIYPLTSSSAGQMLAHSVTSCKMYYFCSLTLSSSSGSPSVKLSHVRPRDSTSALLTEHRTDFCSISKHNNLKELCNLVFSSSKFGKSKNNFHHLPSPKKDF